MVDKIGIIDLGSNTFHLLIVSNSTEGSFNVIHKERSFVGLAAKGLNRISDEAIEKGLKTLKKFKEDLERFGVDKYKVVGTSALRSANNRNSFLERAKNELGISIEVIQGHREAELIFKGVMLLQKDKGNFIIMDIGGGSVEFILVKNGVNFWSRSYDIGVGVLNSEFHKGDPISIQEKRKLNAFLSTTLKDLQEVTKDMKIDALIGASGSFEVVESMNGKTISSSALSEVTLSDYWEVSSKLIQATFVERSAMHGLPETRVKLIVVAMILIDTVIDMTRPSKIMISPYALKEGLLSELNE